MPLTDLPLDPTGQQRDWHWRGWKIRYTYLRPKTLISQEAPVLWLHGFASSLQQWRYNLVPLSETHTVYALDLLGFGASQKAAAQYGTELWVVQVYEFWQTWIGQPVVLVGHSLGALVALRLATLYPDMVDRLVLMTLPAARQELMPGAVNSVAMTMERLFTSPLLLKPMFRFLRRPSLIRKVLQSVYHQPAAVTDELVELFCAPPRDRNAERAFCYLAKARTDPAFTPTTRSLLQHLHVPTLLLWGEQDRVIPLQWGRQVAPLSEWIELIEIADAGHCIYDEHPDQVNQLIEDWLMRSHRGEQKASP